MSGRVRLLNFLETLIPIFFTDESSGNSVVERVQDIYMAVLESEERMERVACEGGGLAADAGLSPKMLT